MILLDREDVVALKMEGPPFLVTWDPNDPVAWAEGAKVDYADILADGPFLMVVTDEDAWAGQSEDHLSHIAQKRADTTNRKRWVYLADLYAAEIGVSRQGFTLRFTSMVRQTKRNRGRWFPWSTVYHWLEGGDLVWSALKHASHPHLEVMEDNGARYVRHKG